MEREVGPARLAGQGLDPNQYESGDRTIAALLAEPPAADQVDLVATWRDGSYEVWARRGMIRFKRYADQHGALTFRIVDQIGENPIANQDPFAIATIDQELAAARASGHPGDDPNRAYIEPHATSYPHAYERIAQLFDSPNAPDLVVSPKCYAFGIQPGQHGALDVVQSRAPLAFAGPGVKRGRYQIAARHVDIAPTIAHLMRFPAIDGIGAAGQPQRAYLKRQDGRVLDAILDGGARGPARVYLIVLDGLSNSELKFALSSGRESIPNLASLIGDGALLTHGSIANFPTITWPSHSTILTGAWCGHHDVVNPAYYDRRTRTTLTPQSDVFETEHLLNRGVETLYEAFKRVHGADAITASIHEPQGRGADHAAFERRLIGDKARLKALTAGMKGEISARWAADHKRAVEQDDFVDIRGLAQALHLFEHCDGAQPPVFVAHEFTLTDGAGHDYGPHHDGLREALALTDRRIGVVFEMLRRRGLYDSTLFVITADHGMASQKVELAANPARFPEQIGIKGAFAEPMIYLRDLAVECSRSRDFRSLRVTVSDNDPRPDGDRPPITGARVTIFSSGDRTLGERLTSDGGEVAFAVPANRADAELRVLVQHPDFNPRNLRADGMPIRVDLRQKLYG